MASCGEPAGISSVWVQGTATLVNQVGTDEYPQYALSAPLGLGRAMQLSSDITPGTPATIKLMLFGAPAFVVNVQGAVTVNATSADTADDASVCIAVGLSSVDQLVDNTSTDGTLPPPQLPAGTIAYNYAFTYQSYASASTFISPIVPPGTYYVSAIVRGATITTGQTNTIVASLSATATPVFSPVSLQSLSLPSAAWSGTSWSDF